MLAAELLEQAMYQCHQESVTSQSQPMITQCHQDHKDPKKDNAALALHVAWIFFPLNDVTNFTAGYAQAQ
jgi:hypothetical protein